MKEQVNHPDHYNSYPVECIDMMQRIWGAEKTAIECEKAKVQRGEARARSYGADCINNPKREDFFIGGRLCVECPHHLATSIDGKTIYCDAPAE